MRFLGGARDSHGGARDFHGGDRHPRRGGHGGGCFSRGGSRGNARTNHGGPRRDYRSYVSSHQPIIAVPSASQPPPSAVEPPKNKNSPVKDGVSFADIARISPPQENPTLKRRRSPEHEEVCKHCLRPGHKVEDCHHQLTCRCCSGVGHFAARCPLKHTPPGSLTVNPSLQRNLPLPKPLLHVPVTRSTSEIHSLRVSLPIS